MGRGNGCLGGGEGGCIVKKRKDRVNGSSIGCQGWQRVPGEEKTLDICTRRRDNGDESLEGGEKEEVLLVRSSFAQLKARRIKPPCTWGDTLHELQSRQAQGRGEGGTPL